MGKRFSISHEVAFYECDVNQTMTFPAMLGIVIQTSEKQSEALGCSSAWVKGFGLTWVITRYEVTIERLPRVGEEIVVTTEAVAHNKYFCYRNFWIHDQQGHELVRIDSTFVLMDLVNRKLSSVVEEIIAPYESEKIKKIRRGTKIPAIQQGKMLTYRVRFNDIDSNQHVNNAMYFNWMFDVLGFEFLTSYQPKKVIIQFDKEVAYGKEVESHYEVIDDAGVESRHQIRIGEQLCSEAVIQWEAKEA